MHLSSIIRGVTYLNLIVAKIKLLQSGHRLEALGAANSVAAHVQLLQARQALQVGDLADEVPGQVEDF